MSRSYEVKSRLNKGLGPLSPPIVSSDIVITVLQPIMRLYSWSCAGCCCKAAKEFICTTIHIAISILRFLMMTERRCLNGIARSS